MGCVDACVHGVMAQVVSSVASQQESFWLDSSVLVGWGPFPCFVLYVDAFQIFLPSPKVQRYACRSK